MRGWSTSSKFVLRHAFVCRDYKRSHSRIKIISSRRSLNFYFVESLFPPISHSFGELYEYLAPTRRRFLVRRSFYFRSQAATVAAAEQLLSRHLHLQTRAFPITFFNTHTFQLHGILRLSILYTFISRRSLTRGSNFPQLFYFGKLSRSSNRQKYRVHIYISWNFSTLGFLFPPNNLFYIKLSLVDSLISFSYTHFFHRLDRPSPCLYPINLY